MRLRLTIVGSAVVAIAGCGDDRASGAPGDSADDSAIDRGLDVSPDAGPDLGESVCFEPHGRWVTCEGHIHDPEGRRVHLRGVNVAQSRKLPPYEGGTSDDDYQTMYRLGLNHARLIWSWAAAMPQPGSLDEDYLDRLADEVARADESDLLVVLDSHQDLYGEAIRTDAGPYGNGAPQWACPPEVATQFEEPIEPWFANYANAGVQGCFDALLTDETLQQQFADAWGAVAERVADMDHVIGYDLYNEPYWGTHAISDWEADVLRPLYERLAGAIVEADDDAMLFLEPGANKNLTGRSNLRRINTPADVVYAPHLYNVQMESGRPWGGTLDFIEDRLVDDFEEAATLGGVPLYIGEWGTPNRNENDAEFIAAVTALFDERHINWAVWQWGPGNPGSYALIGSDGLPHEHALALARPYLSRVAGDELEAEYDPETETFTASFTARTLQAATIVVVPSRLWELGGVNMIVENGHALDTLPLFRFHVQADAPGERVTIELTVLGD